MSIGTTISNALVAGPALVQQWHHASSQRKSFSKQAKGATGPVAHPKGVKAGLAELLASKARGAKIFAPQGAGKLDGVSCIEGQRIVVCYGQMYMARGGSARLVQILKLTLYLKLAAQQLPLWWTPRLDAARRAAPILVRGGRFEARVRASQRICEPCCATTRTHPALQIAAAAVCTQTYCLCNSNTGSALYLLL